MKRILLTLVLSAVVALALGAAAVAGLDSGSDADLAKAKPAYGGGSSALNVE